MAVGIYNTKSFDAQAKALRNGLAVFRQSTQNKIVRGGVAKAMRVVVKAIKGKIPPNFKDAKKAIGGRMMKRVQGSANLATAKVGAAVGMKQDKVKMRAQDRKHKRSGRPGVGIGPENIHWFILGTDNRKREFVKVAGRTTFRQGSFSTGKMPPQFGDAVAQGYLSSLTASHAVMAQHIRAGIQKESSKLAAKVNAARK